MNQVQPQLSVVITCYSEGELILRAVESLEKQTDRNFEIVIVNDASKDAATNQVCKDLELKKKAKVVWRKQNGGLSAARNSGCEFMQGNVCIPLDADDTLPVSAVGAIRDAFLRKPNIDFVFGNYRRIDIEECKDRIVDCSSLCGKDLFLNPHPLAEKDWVFYGGSPFKKSLWKRLGGFLAEFSYDAQDMDFWMRAFISGAKGLYLKDVLYEWRRSNTGMNQNVPAERWRAVTVKNKIFFDIFGSLKVREKRLNQYLKQNDMVSAKRTAGSLLREKKVNIKTLAVFLFPSIILRAVMPFLIQARAFTRAFFPEAKNEETRT